MDTRFKEIVSTQKIIDTKTGLEYNGLVDDELMEIINELAMKVDKYEEESILFSKYIKWYIILGVIIFFLNIVLLYLKFKGIW